MLAFLFLLPGTTLADAVFSSALNGLSVVPANFSPAAGSGSVILRADETEMTVTLYVAGFASAQTSAAIRQRGTGGLGESIVFDLPAGNFSQSFAVTPQQVTSLKAGLWYFEVRSAGFPSGEIRGQIIETHGPAISFPASSGSLDTTFGSNGAISTSVGFGNDVAQAVVIQADGKIVVAGYAYNGTDNDFALVRYNPNGTLDETFDGTQNGNGIVTAAIGTSNDEAFGIALQTDGKIILAGQVYNGNNTDIAVARFNVNGTLDTSFDQDGRVAIAVGTGNDIARSVAVQPDGKLVIAGNFSNGANNDICVIRLDSLGALDPSFVGNSGNGIGIVTTPVGAGNDAGYSVAIKTNGKVVVAGFYFSGVSNDTAVLQYNPNGQLDTSFSEDGIATATFSTDTDEALAMTLQPDGKIVIAGCIRNGSPNDFLIARFGLDGRLDPQFGTSGSTIVTFSSGVDIAMGVAVQPDGRIVAAGFGNNGTGNNFAVTRMNANGSPDTSFGSNGKLLTGIGTSGDLANAVVIQSDGKIVVAGRTVANSFADFGVVRYGYGTNSGGNDSFIALGPTTAIRFENAYQAGTSSVVPLNSASLPSLPDGWSYVGSPRAVRTSALFSGNITVRITLPANLDAANFEAVRILQYENGVWADRTAAAPVRDFASKAVYASISTLSPLAAATRNWPITELRSVTGRLLTSGGRATLNTAMSVTSANGTKTQTFANPFGYFRFRNLTNGGTYLFNVASKRFKYSPFLLSINEDLPDIILATQ